MKYAFGVLLGFVLSGCTGTGQPDVSFPAYFVPTATKSFVVGDITLELSEARVAFGPAYFCASASGSATLCETALGEIRDEAVFDALSSDRQSIGTYHGFVGEVRSVSYDQGIHWFLPQQEARASTEAPGGHSALFRGTASRAGMQAPFEMRIDVESWLSTVDYEQMFGSGEDPYVIESGVVDHDAVVIRMVSNDPVGFVFSEQ